MSLIKYRKKRNFKITPEPKGEEKSRKRNIFVIQKHKASHLHYDFRLENGGVLKSWAVPKGLSLDPQEKRLAMMVEDHPLDYQNFEGVIPEGNYGAGSVIVWDKGTYLLSSKFSFEQSLNKGHLKFFLKGQKLKGEFSLVRIKPKENGKDTWLLIKADDRYARERPYEISQKSVISKKTVEEIDDKSNGLARLIKNLPNGEIHQVQPMKAILTDKPFDKKGWIFEIKWDGYRTIGQKEKEVVKIYSRNYINFNSAYQKIVEGLKQINHDFILDGEIVAFDKNTKPDFQSLQNYQKESNVRLIYYVFDLLYLDGKDIRNSPLFERKKILRELISDGFSSIKYSDHIEEKGTEFFSEIQKENLEGIIAKDIKSKYLEGQRSRNWLKIKTKMRQEAIIVGFTKPRGSRKKFGALILGIYEKNKLIYIGHTGTGFSDESIDDLFIKFNKLKTSKVPFSPSPKTNMPVTWIFPKLVCEVSFSQWTNDGHLRQPVFMGLRNDKEPSEVIKEIPQKKEKLITPSSRIKTVEINEKSLQLSNLDKVFFPEKKITKGDLINYYRRISPYILPYLKDRPQSLHRYPNGIYGSKFYQKDFPTAPKWMKTTKVYSESENKWINYIICNDLETLIYLINLGCIEINVWNSQIDSTNYPDYMVIDLDPHGISFNHVIEAANVAKQVLDKAQIPAYCKTSGKLGLHIYCPTGKMYSYEQIKQFSRIVVTIINRVLPKTTSIERNPKNRQNLIYLDFLQNRKGQTMAAPYCVRPTKQARVSTPILWKEIERGLNPDAFTIDNIEKRLQKQGDIFKDALKGSFDMEKSLRLLSSNKENIMTKSI